MAASYRELERTAIDLRLTEEQLRQTAIEANAANEAKSRFLATMSHEIRTPMNGILGMADLALTTDVDPTQRKYLNVVKQSGQTLLSLLNEILDHSKIEAGKMELEEIEFEVREIVENVTQLFAPTAHKKDLEITGQVDLDVPLTIVGDPNRLRQVIVNLVGNAIKFTTKGGVHVRCSRRVKTIDGDKQSMLEFSVRDTGIGIAEDKQQKVFEAFSQEDSSTTRKYGGTGLGLSICHQLASLMGGSVSLESTPGKGSTFSISIPATDAKGLQQDLTDDTLRGHTAAIISAHDTTSVGCAELLTCLGLQTLTLNSLSDIEDDMWSDFGVVFVDASTTALNELSAATDKRRNLVLMCRPTKAPETDITTLTKPLNLDETRELLCRVLSGRIDTNSNHNAHSPAVKDNGADPNSTADLRILLADDCDVNQAVATGLLELEGFEVECAFDGREAIEKFEAGNFDMILMDLEMPITDGIEATRHIRESSNVPIIALSAHSRTEIKNRCRGVGFDGYLSKPFEPELLKRTIFGLLKARQNV